MTATQRASGLSGVGRALLTGALALSLSAMLLVAAAAPASAEIRSPENNREFPAHTTFDITATYQSLEPSQLRLTPPTGPQVLLREGEGNLVEVRRLSYPFNTLCWNGSGDVCSDDRPAPNGDWRVQQTGGGGEPRASTFRLSIPARPPSAVTAVGTSPREVRVAWRHGTEPDLTAFEVREGEQVVKSIDRADCTEGACATVVTYPADGTGEHTYTVRALRSRGPGVAGEPLPSPPSATASGSVLPVDVVTGPGPVDGVPGGEASPAPSGSPGVSGSPAPGVPGASRRPAGRLGAAPANAAAARRQAFSLGFNAFGPKLGVPKLPPLPQAPAVAQLPDGTFEPTLGFEDQVLSEQGPATGVAGRVTSTVGAAIVSDQLVRSTAAALVLLLTGAHLRRWLSAAPPE